MPNTRLAVVSSQTPDFNLKLPKNVKHTKYGRSYPFFSAAEFEVELSALDWDAWFCNIDDPNKFI